MMGVIQALISIYAESGDKLRSIKRGRHKIVFLLRSPVYLFGTSDWKEPDFVVSTDPCLLYSPNEVKSDRAELDACLFMVNS